MRQRLLSAFSPALLVALVLAACGGQAQQGSTKSGEVVVGSLSSLSGQFSVVGIPTNNGVKLAIQRINEKGFTVAGTTYKFKLVEVDDRSDPAASVAGTTQLIRDEKVVAMFGPVTPVGTGSAELTRQAHKVQFAASSAFFALAGQSNYRELFATGASIDNRANAIADAVKTYAPQVKKVELVGPNDANGAVLVPKFEAALQKNGLTVIKQLYPAGTTNLVPVFTRVASDQADAVIGGWSYAGGSADLANYLQQMDPAGISKNVTFVGYAINLADCNKVGGRTCIAVSGNFDVSNDNPSPRVKQFIADYLKFTGESQLPGVAQAIPSYYDAAFLLVEAMKKAGTVTDGVKIAEALRKATYDGIFYSAFTPEDTIVLVGGLRCTLVKEGKTTSQYCAAK